MLLAMSRRSIWLMALVAVAAVSASGVERLADESDPLSSGDLSRIVGDFGQEIRELLSGEMNSLVDELASKRAAQLDEQRLAALKTANEELSSDVGQEIELAGAQNSGELTQASWGSVKSGAASFAGRLNDRLGSAGSYIGERMSSLSSWVPTVAGKVVAIPARLRRRMQWLRFGQFKVKFNKTYKSLREELYRQMLYLRTQAVVGVQNLRFLLGRSRYLKKATQFADMTSKEFARNHDNRLAETAADMSSAALEMSAEQRDRLMRLAREGRDVFGERPGEHGRRTRRSADELEEEEDDDDSSAPMDIDDPMGTEDSMDTDDEAAMLDAIADQLEESEADQLDDVMSEALDDEPEDEKVNFRPVDLRATGCVQEPANQYMCGNCYAHAVMSAASYYDCMENNRELPGKYNSRFLSDCGKYVYPAGSTDNFIRSCAGGKLGDTIKFAARAGNFAFYTYEAARARGDYSSLDCAYERPESIDGWGNRAASQHFRRSTFTWLKMKDVNLHLRTVGPVFVNIRTWKDFELQGEGIYDGLEESKDPTVHSMVVVGQDRDQRGRLYYIIKDSHGTAFADNGFVRIYRRSLEHFKLYFVGLIPS